MMKKKRALILAPHPDDAEIAMGGTICKMLDDGWEVIAADLTNGEPTPAGSPEIRARESAQAAKVLNLTERTCLNLPNRYLQNDLQSRTVVAEAIRKYRPRWLFTTFKPDAHPDHIHAAELVQDARFAAKLTKTEMAYEPWYPEKVIYFYASHLRVHPDPRFVVDISDYWQQKVQAISAYRSQFWDNQSDPQQKGSIIQRMSDFCRYFGNRIGAEYGEPFYCHELVGLSGLNSVL